MINLLNANLGEKLTAHIQVKLLAKLYKPFCKGMEPHAHWIAHPPDANRLQHSGVAQLSENHARLELHGRLVIVGLYAPHKPWVAPERFQQLG